MNNSQMYELPHVGGIPYPETDRCYYYDKWYTTTGLTDGGEYKGAIQIVRSSGEGGRGVCQKRTIHT